LISEEGTGRKPATGQSSQVGSCLADIKDIRSTLRLFEKRIEK